MSPTRRQPTFTYSVSSAMVNAPTPWVVRTTKRKSLASVPNPRERRRTFQNAEDGLGSVRCRPHQQTLTQIQFVPRRPQDDRNDEIETRTTMTKRAQVRRNGGRVQKRNSTLTQMDFLATSAFHDNNEDGLTPLPDDGNIQDGERGFMQLDGSGDLPSPRRQRGTPFAGKSMSKRKSTPVVSQESQDFRPPQKKRKTSGEATADNSEHRRRTSSRVASVKATRSISLLSARYGEDNGDISESFETPSIGPRAAAAAPHEQDSPALLQGPSWPAWDQQNQPPSPHKIPRASFPRTPSKKKDVVPSSWSPDSLPSSTRRRNGRGADNHVLSQERSPLKERSVNVQLSRWRRDSKESSLNCLQRPSPPKRKIRVLKHPRHKLQQEQAPVENVKAVPKNSRWILSSSSPKLEESEKPLVIPIPEVRDSNEDSEPSQPTTQLLQSLMMEVEDSVEEDDIEIPGTSQLSRQRALVSSRSAMQIQERVSSIRELLGLRGAREEATSLQETKKENSPGHSDVAVKNRETDYAQRRAPQSPKMGFKQDKPRSVKSPGAAYVADSEEEGSVFALSPGSSIANSTQFNAELAERIPTSSADATPSPPATPSRRKSFSPSSQLNHEIELSLPRPRLVHQPSAYSTTTKVVPLNDTSSSPSVPLPSNPRTVYPASLPRPSQVSTQDATQPYLSLSSMPLAPVSSPTGSRPATITIKDSSSAPRPLRDIPWERHSQSQPQSQLDVNVGLDDCLDAEDDDKLNKEVAAMSDEADPGIDYQQESQVVPQPLQTSHVRGRGEVRSWTTEQGSPVRKRRPRKPAIPPEVRAVLGESILESVPGPPGWSQRSWDDELL